MIFVFILVPIVTMVVIEIALLEIARRRKDAMLYNTEKMACARNIRSAYMHNHHLQENTIEFNKIINKRGIINAIKRLLRRSWIKEGYLDDAAWLLNNGSYKLYLYALDNLERNGWTVGKIYGSSKE